MKESLAQYMARYQQQLEQGTIQKAYKGLIDYLMALRNHLIHHYPQDFTAGNLYQGYMDYSYFSFTPEALKIKKLKTVIVFYHEKARFQICLAGQNKQIQEKYWQLLKNECWSSYLIPNTAQDFIVESVLVEKPDFDSLEALTTKIETLSMKFIQDMTQALNRLS